MLIGPANCQQEVSIIESFNCTRIYLSPFIASVGLPFLIFILSCHTKALVRQQKAEIVHTQVDGLKLKQSPTYDGLPCGSRKHSNQNSVENVLGYVFNGQILASFSFNFGLCKHQSSFPTFFEKITIYYLALGSLTRSLSKMSLLQCDQIEIAKCL